MSTTDPTPQQVLDLPLTETAAGEATEIAAAGQSADADGYWACIAFLGHNEHTGYVTEITKNGQPAYHIDLPGKIWGGNPLAYVEYAASAWFSDQPVTEESVRRAWERHLREAAERKRREAEWERMQEQRALTAGGSVRDGDGPDDDEDDPF